MKNAGSLIALRKSLARETGYMREHEKARTAKRVQSARGEVLASVTEIARSGDLSPIIATERAIVENDLKLRHAAAPRGGDAKAPCRPFPWPRPCVWPRPIYPGSAFRRDRNPMG